MGTDIRPFRIEIPQADVADLHRRLAATRWPRQLPGGDRRGVPVDRLRALAGHWRTGYDWRAAEAALNRFPQYVTEIDGLDVHFLHVRAGAPDAVPLVLTHGWPNSFVEFARLVEPLARPAADGPAFDVVVPSVPGFGFSAPPRDTGWTPRRVAGVWAELMRRLGYDRYGVQGGDLGAYVAPEVARLAPDRVLGVYVTAGLGIPAPDDVPTLTPDERTAYDAMMSAGWTTGVDHHGLLRAAPQTFAYGWHDSPVALLAWLTQKFTEFGTGDAPLDEVIDRDLLLTNASVWWFTGTSGTSAWPYYDSTASAWPEGQKAVPTGVYSGPPGFRRLAERYNAITHWPTDNPGSHHFPAMAVPEAMAADLRAFFAPLAR
jgi:pimeloyl-ACP methyl ester carboxylesterase